MPDVRVRGPRARGVRVLAATGALAGLLAGCGIRATQVPTDFGPAPSMVPCELSMTDITPHTTPSGMPVEVFLLCSGALVRVNRSVEVAEGTDEARRRVVVAQGLLDALAAAPTRIEDEAGYGTAVPPGLTVTGPAPGDPEDALRLSTAPDALPRYALAQIVCTFADSAAAGDNGSVVLGSTSAESLRRYECASETQSTPGAGNPPSTEVGGS
ncbi:hypothetical protein PV385_26530 [Streptomyces stelliscabiei]|nr:MULTISPECIES: hypothetical protein [Streptomyces]MDX2519628.1 hypothetical protein [Streptomyces stelliscabiei]MDX2553813.1 hypothetical protein [Streptomyces stelliscabiei]MDX2612556.1 hypothetical protein [Streptomyces stelliscabiei]MDX2638400.1 hypothetical protein [Streptomyces stelliscabiei]MDX2663871.1 hypothetical protein [Streptomyces stelliscabiei]